MAKLYLSENASDLYGGYFNKYLETYAQTGSYNFIYANVRATNTAYGFCKNNVISSDKWTTGDIKVQCELTNWNSSDTVLYLSVQVCRIDSLGNVLESTGFSAEQQWTANMIMTFTFLNKSWGIGSVTDRLRVDYKLNNTSRKSGFSIYIKTGETTFIDAPIPLSVNIDAICAKATAKIPWDNCIDSNGEKTIISSEVFDTSWVSPIDANRFLVVYEKKNSDGIFAKIGTISGLFISYGAEFAFNSGVNSYLLTIDKLDNSHFIVTHGAHSIGGSGSGITIGGYAFIITIDGESISFGNIYPFDTIDIITCTKILVLSSNRVIIGYIDLTALKYKFIVATIDDLSISYGIVNDWLATSSYYGGYMDMYLLPENTNKMILTFEDGSDYGYTKSVVVDISGDTLTFNSPNKIEDNWSQSISANSAFRREVAAVYALPKDSYNYGPFTLAIWGGEYEACGFINYEYFLSNYDWKYLYNGGGNIFTGERYAGPEDIDFETASCLCMVTMSNDLHLIVWDAFWSQDQPYIHHIKAGIHNSVVTSHTSVWVSEYVVESNIDTYTNNYIPISICKIDSETAVISYTSGTSIYCQVIKLHYSGIGVIITDPKPVETGNWKSNLVFYVKKEDTWYIANADYIKNISKIWSNPVKIYLRKSSS